jgi:hypothetical protein
MLTPLWCQPQIALAAGWSGKRARRAVPLTGLIRFGNREDDALASAWAGQ